MFFENKLLLVKRLLHNTKQFHSSRFKRGYEGPGRTIVDITNLTDTTLLINKCVQIGFKMNDDSLIIGPIAIFPTGILSWNVGSTKDINEASLSLFTILKPPLDILVLGLESTYEYNRVAELKKMLLKFNIRNEILPVEKACGVYNFLISEGRHVAAGLIPPVLSIPHKLETSLKTLTEDKKLIDST
ncbi:NADH dehydrogenase [ubiquinone] 1 alpha subcomplex assembly factor 3 [Anthophora quadrimaculata]